MKDASTTILQELSARGYRVTEARKNTLTTLQAAEQPLTIGEIARKTDSDEASVYRTVRMLVQEGFLEELVIAGSAPRYALLDHDDEHHHHHVVCDGCGFVAHIPCEETAVHASLPKDFSEITAHEVTLHGLCKKCT